MMSVTARAIGASGLPDQPEEQLRSASARDPMPYRLFRWTRRGPWVVSVGARSGYAGPGEGYGERLEVRQRRPQRSLPVPVGRDAHDERPTVRPRQHARHRDLDELEDAGDRTAVQDPDRTAADGIGQPAAGPLRGALVRPRLASTDATATAVMRPIGADLGRCWGPAPTPQRVG